MTIRFSLFGEFFDDIEVNLSKGDISFSDPFVSKSRVGIKNNDVGCINPMGIS